MQNRIKSFVKRSAISKGRPVSVCLYGLGKTNMAIWEAIKDSEDISYVTVRQNGEISHTVPEEVIKITKGEALYRPDEDVVFASPSLRREKLSLPEKTVITSDTELFFDAPAGKVFTVSGSDGKSTVTTLASLLFHPTFPDVFVGGNLGVPLASASLQSSAFVLELSSFNLRYTAPRSDRAVITNITPNHLDWHSDLAEYEDCKIKLINSSEESVLNLDCPRLAKIAKERESFALVSAHLGRKDILKMYNTLHTVTAEGDKICIDGDAVLYIGDVRRSEEHNLTNLMLAISLSLGYTEIEHICKVAQSFTGLAHRCEIFSVGGVEYVNSSIDTTPDRTKTTLEALKRRGNIILGGCGKGLSYDVLRIPLLKYAKRISLYGKAADEISEWLDSDFELSTIPKKKFTSFDSAIDYATLGVSACDTVILSPAATSYGEFCDYAERGDHFKEYIKQRHLKI